MLLVLNDESGDAGVSAASLEAFCAEDPKRRRLLRLSAEEVARGEWLPATPTLVVACGGDGTLTLCANQLAGGPHVLGLLPLGTLDIFARRVGISRDPGEALEQLRCGVDRPVDAARLDDTLFLNSAIFGLYPQLVARRERWRTEHAHWPTALRWVIDTTRAAAQLLVHWRHSSFAIEFDGEALSGRYVTFAVTNNALSFKVEPSSLDEGRLWIYLPRTLQRLEHARLVLRNIFFAQPQGLETLETRRVRELLVHLPDGTHYSVDGEARRVRGSLRLRSEPGALTMRLPARTAAP